MIDGARVLSVAKEVSLQNLGVGEGAVVLMIETGQLYTCNDTTAVFLTAIDGKRTFTEIIDELGFKFDVAPDELRMDLSALTEKLIEDGIIR